MPEVKTVSVEPTEITELVVHHKLPAVFEEDQMIAVFFKLDDADLFATAKRKELAAQEDNRKLAEAEKLKLRAREIEREVLDKGRDSDCG